MSRILIRLTRSTSDRQSLDIPSTPLSYKVHSDNEDDFYLPSPHPTHRISASISPRTKSIILPHAQRKSTSVIGFQEPGPNRPALSLSPPLSPLGFQVQVSPPSLSSPNFSTMRSTAIRCSLAVSPRNSFMMTSSTFRTQGFSIGQTGLFNNRNSLSPSQTLFAVHKGRQSAFLTESVSTSFSDFELLGTGGKGASASVFKALRLDRIGLYVLKSIDVYSQEKRRQLIKELTTFADMYSSNNVVQFYGAYYNSGRAMLVLEYMNRGSLQSCVQKCGPLPPPIVFHFAKQIFAGLAYIHERHLVHRDIKPGNVLVSKRGRLKLTDFGISETLRSSKPYLDGFIGTQVYMSPERLEGGQYGMPADIWAAGLVLVYVSLGRHPYSTEDGFFGIIQQIQAQPIPDIPDHFPDEFRNLLSCCLQPNPDDRWTAKQLLQHPLLNTIDANEVLKWELNEALDEDIRDLSDIANILVDKRYKNIDEPIQESVRLEDLVELSKTLEIDVTDIRKAIISAYCKQQPE